MTKLRTLFENEPVKGIQKNTDFMYIKILRGLLKPTFSWPSKELGEKESMLLTKIGFTLYIICHTVLTSMIAVYIKIHFKKLTFLQLGHSYVCFLLATTNLIRMITLTRVKRYRTLLKKFFTEIHLFCHKDASDFAMEMHKRVHRICHIFTLVLVGQEICGCTCFHFTPVYSNYAAGKFKPGGLGNSTYDLSLYFAYPVDVERDPTYYLCFGVFFNWGAASFCTLGLVSFDLLLCIMVFHVWGHFKILLNDFASFPLPKASFVQIDQITIKNQSYTEEDLKVIKKKIKDCVLYHRKIVRFTNEMSDTFGPMLLEYYTFFQAACCVLLLESSEMTLDALLRYGSLTFIVYQQLIVLSFTIEMVGSVSEQLQNAVYGMPWEHMDTKNRKGVLIFLMNVHKPIYIKALGVVNVGVQLMASILKTSFTYYAFLRSCKTSN